MGISQTRAISVMNELDARGIAKERQTFRAWGRKVSTLWSEPEDDKAARAELFFSLDGVQFPQPADYYNLLPQDQEPPICEAEVTSPQPSSDDEAVTVANLWLHGGTNQWIRLNNGEFLPLALLRTLLQARGNEQEANDSSDSEVLHEFLT